MREAFSEWECMPGSAPGLIESMDAAGFVADVDSALDDPEHGNDPEHDHPEHDDPGHDDPEHDDPEHDDPEHGDPGSEDPGSMAAMAGIGASGLAQTEAIRCLDLRQLPAPEPLERAIAAADALSPGAKLEVWTPMLPVPLLQLLDARGFTACAELLKDGTARIVVARGSD